MRSSITQSQATTLLHNKFVVVLGDSVQRGIYKDLVLLLQTDQFLSWPQLKSKGEFSFENDYLVEGGQLDRMNNGTEYKEVRQYQADHHLVRFYFLTRIFSRYMKSILEDLKGGLKPDVIIISSCVWDISRYGSGSLNQYKENLHVFFREIRDIVPRDCLIVWNLAMPLGSRIKGGFLVPEVSHLAPSLRNDVIEANFYSCVTAEAYNMDILDLHYHFRRSLQHRMPDGIHWDSLAHRRISALLLQHIANAWGVTLQDVPSIQRQVKVSQSQRGLKRTNKSPERPRSRPSRQPQNSEPVHRVQPFPPHPPLIQGFPPMCPPIRWLIPQHQIHFPPMYIRFSTGGDFGFQADDRCMRRRRRANRSHPYHQYLP
ncbi:PC-esterase domain-containing protein 1A isoform X2 [Xyrichtys novacula]|uniref:PC-esterase domain-containing protein 1A isoform X2 n=1 Tax=Xyrichtys novacula TaxID=13765 RepID=A0AAV1HKP6_XYRNO|nr:PC-esterase domain-containing protein 1A isoform X2 [Xyrichtys novacula]